MGRTDSSAIFERSFLRLRDDLERLRPAVSCCGWVCLYDVGEKKIHTSLYPATSPVCTTYKTMMAELLIPKILKTQHSLIFLDDLGIDSSFEYPFMHQLKHCFTRGVMISQLQNELLYTGVLVINGLDHHSFSILTKIYFSFLDFFDVGIRHIESVYAKSQSTSP